jgi:hypothetical protein
MLDRALVYASRPLPAHFLQGAGYIRLPASAGCFTRGKPVPSQASHFISSLDIPNGSCRSFQVVERFSPVRHYPYPDRFAIEKLNARTWRRKDKFDA